MITVSKDTQGYFYTDWSAMTATDWGGLIFTIVIFILMVIAYFYVLRPKSKELEEHKYIVMDDEEPTKHGEKK